MDSSAQESSEAVSVPVFQEYMNPIVAEMKSRTTPISNEDLNIAVAKRMGLSPKVLAVLHDPDKSQQPEAFYRMAWSRTYLKKMGFIDNPTRGAWIATEAGKAAEHVDPNEIVRRVQEGAQADDLSSALPDHVVDELLELHQQILSEDGLPTGDELDGYYLRFKDKYGPEVLRRLDGEELLVAMHGRGTKDSLTYWLEFKNDEEFPAIFGSIAGGSALKFGIYQSADTGHWITGHPHSQKRLSQNEAIQIARKQRDQLVAGADVLKECAAKPEEANYDELQGRMEKAAPDLANMAWGHKYFSLLYPNLIDDYHALNYQQYHLIRLHKRPTENRYENARLYLEMARSLSLPICHFTTVLNRRHGNPRQYWRVGTSVGDSGDSEWPRMRDGGFAAIGWSDVGSLETVEHTKVGKDHVRALTEQHYPGKSNIITRSANQLFQFATAVDQGDVVVAMKGNTVLGVGTFTGPYYHKADDGPFAHRRPVKWHSLDEWRLPNAEALRTTFKKLARYPMNLVEIERRLAGPGDEAQISRGDPKPKVAPELPALEGLLARIQTALQRKNQVILYGPPGTGKTYWAEQAMNELAARSWFGVAYHDTTQQQRDMLIAERATEQCCFHSAYGYEDFLIGYRPVAKNDQLTFQAIKGIFARLCERAQSQPKRHFFLLIDEINRGDIPRIFGELLTVIEKDKRGKAITLPISGEPLVVPPNVFLIGTMNTADRSIALLDAALRRRFAFVELMPDSTTLRGASVSGLPLGPWLDELNRRIVRHAGRDARNLQIGHAYLMRGGEAVRDPGRFAELLRDDILPLLQEYCYEDFDALEKILGSTIVRRERQGFDQGLFLPSRRGELTDALLAAFESITATPEAAEAVDEPDTEEDDSTDDEDDDGEAGE